MYWLFSPSKSSQSPFPRPMAHRAAPTSVSIALGHASTNTVKATAGAGPLLAPVVSLSHSTLMSSARREGSEYHFQSLWYDSAGARTHDLPVVRQTLYHWAITPSSFLFFIHNTRYMLCNIFFHQLVLPFKAISSFTFSGHSVED